MDTVKIGLIREGKVPPDKRVPLTPAQCKQVMDTYEGVEVVVQTSAVRAFSDDQYRAEGIAVQDNLEDCEYIFGVKEVNIEDLIPNKTFMFFSHTIKKQPYNRKLLRAILDKKIQLIDYEVLRNKTGKRIIGFGRYAGIVGAYNGILALGKKTGRYDLKPAHACFDRQEMERELEKVKLPSDFKIVLTGFGRVGYGAREIVEQLSITEVSPEEFMNGTFDQPVFTHLETNDYYANIQTGEYDKKEFYQKPELYKSVLGPYVQNCNMYIACHFWGEHSPLLLQREDLQKAQDLKVVADISCDIDGPIPCTLRPSTIADPTYGYDAQNHQEVDWNAEGAIVVMAVDNLPCELPKDASESFGNELIQHVLPCLLKEDEHKVIERASETTKKGELGPHFAFLQDYVDGKE